MSRSPSNLEFLLKRNKDIRAKKVRDYYKDPPTCKYCGEVIKLKDGQPTSQAKKKKFCDKNHAASYNNNRYPKRKKVYKLIIQQIGGDLGRRTKKQLFNKSKYYTVARNKIRKHAYRTYERSGKPKKCYICGYDVHVDVCHIKPVSEFPDNAFVHDINRPDNLVALCPNHHWELDNGYLEIQREG